MPLNDLNILFLLLYNLLISPVMEMTNHPSVVVLGHYCCLALYIFTETILSRVIMIIFDRRDNCLQLF